MKRMKMVVLGLMGLPYFLNAQTGPGGVGNSNTNILWLKADAITGVSDGASISSWNDQSGNGNNFSQSTGPKQPVWDQINSDFNSRASVHFDGSSQFFDYGNGQMNAASNYTIFFVYKTTSTTTQYLFDTKTGKLKIPHEGGGDKAYNDGGGRGVEITGTGTKLVTWWLNSSGASIFENGSQTQTGLTYTQRAINASTSLGANEKGNGSYVSGDIAEAIIYNTAVNSAQRTIIENYLAAKYNLTISNDNYSYQSAHGNDVAGIGRIDASNTNTAAESAGIFRMSNASDLGDGEYALFGHDNGSISNWTATETPGSNLQRIAREWRIDETGDVGTVTISLDTALLPSKPSGYTKYVVWIDADGDFSNGATQYVLSLNSGFYEKTLYDISDGYYITFGVMKPVVRFSYTSASGSESISPVSVHVGLNYSLLSAATVDYVVTGGSANGGGEDYTLADGTANINSGATMATFDISINDDSDEESDETIVIKLRNPSTGIALGADSIYTYTINDNDASRKIQFETTSGSGLESNSAVAVNVKINLVDAVDTTSVNYTVSGGTATGGGTDFTLTDGTVKIPPGDTMTSFAISINDDALDEDNETILVLLSGSSSNANVGINDSFTYTITDNDASPQIAFTSTTSQGSESQTNPVITVNISAISGKNISADYSVVGGTATGGGVDYTLSSGTLNIAAGETTAVIPLTINDDPDIEVAETVIMQISNPVNSTIGTYSTHTFTINDDDNLGSTGPGGVGDNISNILWLRADKINGVSDGAGIGTWSDQSGNGADAVQSASGDQPVYDQVNPDFNNMPSVKFVSNDFMDLAALTDQPASDFSFIFVYKTTSTASQFLFDTRSGKIKIPHEGGGDKAFNDGSARGTPITGTGTQLVFWELDDAGSSIYVNGATTQSGLAYTQRAISDRTKLGSNENDNGKFLSGDIAEGIIFNKTLNSVQRSIIENYLAAKYGLSISDDKYAYESTHGYDVSGIGSEGLPNVHTSAQSAGIVTINAASDLGSGEYLLFGHDNGAITTWDTTGAPNQEIKLLSRSWRIDETGDVGTVSITIDTTLLPARPAEFSGYAILVDVDGDFTSGFTAYPATLESGSNFVATNVAVADGNYIAIGVSRFMSSGTGNFSSPSLWYGGVVPGPGEPAIIGPGSTITLDDDQTVGSLEIHAGATFNLGSHTISIDDSTIINNGTFNAGTGTINYSKNGNQDVAKVDYYGLTISGSGTKVLTGDITVNGDITLSSGTLDADGTNSYDIDLKGNWINTGGTFTQRMGNVTFSGSSDQEVTSNGQPFYDVTINNTALQVSLNDNLSVNHILTMTDGVITTGTTYRVEINSDSSTAMVGFSNVSFVNGNLRRYIAVNTSTYAFPIGNGTASANYYRADIVNGNLTGINYIDSKFKPLANHDDNDLDVVDSWRYGYINYTTIDTAGVWELEPQFQPSGGTYDVKLYFQDMSRFSDNEFGPLKRPVGSVSAADWSTGGGALNNDDGDGRLVAQGYMIRKGLTSFSEFGGGGGSGGGAGLPIELISFKATVKSGTVKLNWATATEINNDYFTVERSADGNSFEPILVEEAAGNSSSLIEYTAMDGNPLKGISFYRLKQTDFDGAFTYSDVVSVWNADAETAELEIFPNPAVNATFYVRLPGVSTANRGWIRVFDLPGKVIYQSNSDNLSVETRLEFPNLKSGIYFVEVKNEQDFVRKEIFILN